MVKKLKSILLIDDDTIFTWLTKKILEEANLAGRVDTLNDASVALDIMIKLAASKVEFEQNCPDIIFLDVNMPGMNGFEFLDKLKLINGCEDVPRRIVVLSTSTLERDVENALSHGVLAYVEKPLTPVKVMEIVEQLQFSCPSNNLAE